MSQSRIIKKLGAARKLSTLSLEEANKLLDTLCSGPVVPPDRGSGDDLILECKLSPDGDESDTTPSIIDGPSEANAHYVADKIQKIIETILVVYRLYGFSNEYSTETTFKHWMKLVNELEGQWMKVAKYKLAAFVSSWIGNELPISPFKKTKDTPTTLLSGSAGEWIGFFIRNQTPIKKFSLIQTLTLSKNGMPRPGKLEMDEQEKQTLEILTKEPTTTPFGSWADRDEEVQEQNIISEEIRRTVRELFQGETYTWEDRINLFLPSTSANYINNREGAGAVGTILDGEYLKDLKKAGGYLKTTEERNEENMESHENNININIKELEHKFGTLYARLLKAAINEPKDAKLQPLSEALKVRIISKGPPITYTILKPLQRKMHSVLKKHPVFRLVGEEVTEKVILGGMGKSLRPGEEYVSGDYKAATDNLKRWAIEAAAYEISNILKLTKTEERLFIEALTGHTINGIPQTEGQLMGSIVSFPLLCIINAAISRYSIEKGSKKKLGLRNCRLLINGDDLVFRALRIVRELWKRNATIVGLTPSIGKCFYSRDYLNINSRFFLREEKEHEILGDRVKLRACPFRIIPHVNLGMLLGFKRSLGHQSSEDDPRNNMGVIATELHDSCPAEMRYIVMLTFLNTHREKLEKSRLPWFLPRWLGGIGLPPFGEISRTPAIVRSDEIDYDIIEYYYDNSDLDLRLANGVLMNWEHKRPIELGGGDKPWRLRQEAVKGLPKPKQTYQKTEEHELYERALSYKVVDLLFDANIKKEDLYIKLNEFDSENRDMKAMKHNATFYSPKTGIIADKILDRNLIHKRLYDYLPIVKIEKTKEIKDEGYYPRGHNKLVYERESEELDVVIPSIKVDLVKKEYIMKTRPLNEIELGAMRGLNRMTERNMKKSTKPEIHGTRKTIPKGKRDVDYGLAEQFFKD